MTLPSQTPVRAALEPASPLMSAVQNGLGALQKEHRKKIDSGIQADFCDSLDLDSAIQSTHPQDNRWDYLLGHAPTDSVVALEPHSANTSEVSVVIAKKSLAQQHLRGHLRAGVKVRKWIWVASGPTRFVPFDKQMLRLATQGITFAGEQVQSRHL